MGSRQCCGNGDFILGITGTYGGKTKKSKSISSQVPQALPGSRKGDRGRRGGGVERAEPSTRVRSEGLSRAHPMRTEYWKSRISPRAGTKKKRHARRRGPDLTPMPTAIMPMYSSDNMLVARNAAISRENMVISSPQFCTSKARVLSGISLGFLVLRSPEEFWPGDCVQ